MKFCKDCKHCIPGHSALDKKDYRYSKCAATRIEDPDLVGGGPSLIEINYCSVNRMANQPCGPDARQFEPLTA